METTQRSSSNTPQTAKFSTLAKPTQPNSISKVRVVVRVRPFLPHEINAQNGNPIPCVSVLDQECEAGDEVAVHLKDQQTSRNECYKLDSFFGQEDNNVSQIFHREVSPLIPGIFYGCNATVFAYGATGSGKTYTMQGTDELPGLMPLAMSTVLSMCRSTGSTVEISYYEVYMDRCYDLLELKAKEIAVLDGKDGQIHLRGLSWVRVNSMSEFHEVFSCGIQRRKVAHTGLNDVSSRSHGVLVIAVSTPCGNGSGTVVTGKLNLIDLAGNEDNRRTCNEGIRLQESAKINQSLFALSNVIYALNNKKPRVPYRESKLTRILQDSLGGTSRALMVACLNPGEYQESVHTVSLAARSRHISNFVPSAPKQDTPKVKVDMEAKLRAWLESKGKTKSAQRMGAFGSPFFTKTPGSVSSLKTHNIHHRSAKAKVVPSQASDAKEGASYALPRNLFNNGAVVDSWMEDMCFPKVEDSKACFDSTKDCLTISEDSGILENSLIAPPYENSQLNSFSSLDLAAEDCTEEEIKAAAAGDGLVLILPDELSVKEQKIKTMTSTNFVGSPTISGVIKEVQSSPRQVLSPINSNVNRNFSEDHLSKDHKCSVVFEAKTPKTPFLVTHENNRFQTIDTPLDKFNAYSSNLKTSLIQGYVDFLNTASREELLELKGIGLKRAEYILEVRETSPLKSLSDLEKIGLSSKQVHNMFSTTARGLF
ncbi:hypothetical protein L1049_008473 [Liquidambar formosana]|uniref:Kinesin-like protein n=1 Tax=Liquidambar formosana TaxID=63359 RepID=A0AAP0X4L8_LIQFO